jgi:hypothetical protein
MIEPQPGPQPIRLSQQVLFLHIAKTAGTSTVEFFRNRLPPGTVCSHGDFIQFPSEPAARLSKLGEFKFISGHFGYSEIAPLLETTYSFTFLRDPVERVLSLYKFFSWPETYKIVPAAKPALELGLEGFLASTLPEVCEVLDNQQVWQIAHAHWRPNRLEWKDISEDELFATAVDHLQQFSFVGLTETFAADFELILRQLGIDEEVPRKKVFETRDPITGAELSPSVLAALKERLALDYALLEHVRAQRQQN